MYVKGIDTLYTCATSTLHRATYACNHQLNYMYHIYSTCLFNVFYVNCVKGFGV